MFKWTSSRVSVKLSGIILGKLLGSMMLETDFETLKQSRLRFIFHKAENTKTPNNDKLYLFFENEV